jgi:hypothetical protein
MKLITRAQLGWPASAAPTQTTTKGTKIHYEGTAVSTKLLTDHGACITEWKNIRASHLANTTENYSDVAYNYAACPHGFLLEGRGLRRRTGANGNASLNQAHYAILGLVGSSGLTEPTGAMLSAIRDGIELLRNNGAGLEIKGHRDGYATLCPGTPLYTWVQKGAPRPTTPAPPQEDDVPLTDTEKTEIAKLTAAHVRKELLLTDFRYKAPTSAADYSPDPENSRHWWAGQTVYEVLINTVRQTATDLTALTAKVDAIAPELTPAQLQSLAAQVSTSPTLAESIAELVADKLAARLAE